MPVEPGGASTRTTENIGAAKVARAAPDGYTLLLHNVAMGTAPTLYRSLPYKPLEDFEYLGLVSEVPMTLIGRHDLPATQLADLTRLIAAAPGKLTIANAGIGSAAHLCGLLFQHALRANLVTVPYKGTGPAMADLLGGQVDLMCDVGARHCPSNAPSLVLGMVVARSAA